ncbi:helix-turn-helix transcriptional regulator [Raineyella sp.]|uniref:helix-turn-helix transcriptional regulator n=1 Tax=Raineyella sp. TaxID=1911550 RepID=UPI002B1F313C|nr:WYL domain-containing protein [Raineyella sp.]MEA5154840.1 WYL domain-containing protein [Raineyella sp.]
MGDLTDNLITLLRLLESRTRWPAGDLAASLGVTPPTIRRYITRLRDLGYGIEHVRGDSGGYRLTAGRAMPPLVMDDEEATATAIALRRSLLAPTPLAEDGTLRALAKIEQVLPERVRAAVAAHDTEQTVLGEHLAATLAVITEGIRDGRVLRFAVLTDHGLGAPHRIEPLVVRARMGQWFLMGYDRDLRRIVTWPVERIIDSEVTTIAFDAERHRRPRRARDVVPDDLPAPVVAVVEVQAPPTRVRAGLPDGVGFIEPLDSGWSRVMISGTSTTRIARQLLLLPEVFTVIEPEELRVELRAIAEVLAGV